MKSTLKEEMQQQRIKKLKRQVFGLKQEISTLEKAVLHWTKLVVNNGRG